MKIPLILLLLCAFSFIATAQTDDSAIITVSGSLVDVTDAPVSFATITNLSNHKGVVCDEEGFFYMQINRYDTLQLSAVGYEKYHIYFGDTAKANSYDMLIRLDEKTYQLEDVTVFAYRDEASFKKAILALDDKALPKEKAKITIPGAYEGPRIEKRPGLASSPISFAFDRLSKRARYEREARKVAQDYAYQKVLDKKYNRDLVGKITGLKDTALDEFMMYCKLEDSFVEDSNDYDIIVAINHCYEDYKRTRN